MTEILYSKLEKFMNPAQLSMIVEMFEGEEGEYFKTKLAEVMEIINKMPQTYETETQDDPLILLHYFVGGCDWYITEKDINPDQNQAFGVASMGYEKELGYISIQQLLENNVELDLYWEPITVKQLKAL